MVFNFSGGLITNPGDHASRNREVTAQWLMNCRSDEQGWLAVRNGRIKLSEQSRITAIFAHQGYVFAIVDHTELKWATGEDFTFQSFAPVVNVQVNDLIRGHANFIPIGDEKIFVGGLAETLVIDISEEIPSIQLFRLPDTPTLGHDVGTLREGDIEVGLRAQAMIADDDGNRIVVAPISEIFRTLNINDPEGLSADELTTLTVSVSVLNSDLVAAGVTHIEFWTTILGYDSDDLTNLVSLGRIRYEVGETITTAYSNPLLSKLTSYVDAGEDANFQYLAVDDFRAYAAERNSNRLYFSYYDPVTHERLYQNFTDFDNLELQGGEITGLHFLNETRLIVFATNQIQMYSVDPDPSLIQVFEIISPGTDRGKVIGCVSPQSIVDVSSQIYFLAANNYVYRLDERGLAPISDPVNAVFQTVRKRATDTGKLLLTHAVGFVHQENYLLSLPINEDEPTRTIIYDLVTRAWWQDDFGIFAVSKNESDRIFGIINGRLYALYEGDDDDETPIERNWKGNPYFQHSHSHWESVHVYGLAAMTVDVVASTEQDRVEGTIDTFDAGDWFGSRMGVGLRGRYYIVEITTESLAAIDRITVNERPRKYR